MDDYKKYIFCIILPIFFVKTTLSQERFIFDTLDNWLTVGIFDSDIKKNIGLPDSVSNSEIWEFTGYEYQYWYYKDLGLTMLLEKKDGVFSVYSIELIGKMFKEKDRVFVSEASLNWCCFSHWFSNIFMRISNIIPLNYNVISCLSITSM